VLIILMFAPRILAFSTFPRTCGHALSVVLGHVLDSMRADKGLFLISGYDVSICPSLWQGGVHLGYGLD
jgi:hypothetical protein